MRTLSTTGRVCGLLVIALGALALPAAADTIPITTFGFTDLAANYDVTTGAYTAVATAITDGDVTRLVPMTQTAVFSSDFTPTPADFVLQLQVTNVNALTADALGTFTITDVDGDQIKGDLVGIWGHNGVFAVGAMQISNVTFVQLLPGATFDGPSGGSFSLDYSQFDPAALAGMLTGLQTGGWFDASWSGVNTLVQASILPEPVSGLLAAAGLLLIRRR